MKSTFLPIAAATVWISLSEFLRNTFLLRPHWVAQYEGMGLVFPESPVNGAAWGIWSLCLAVAVFVFSKKYTLWQTAVLTWFIGFVLMWLVIGNLGVLPWGILPLAVPLSMLEAYVASFIVFRLSRSK
jgi:hypothetical protein